MHRDLDWSFGGGSNLSNPPKQEKILPNTHIEQPFEKDFNKGIKDDKDKLSFELDWEFLSQMAEKMSLNKHKYEPYNWKKPMDVEKLKQALFRHVFEVMKGNYEDDGRPFGHLESISLNSMMINHQLKQK